MQTEVVQSLLAHKANVKAAAMDDMLPLHFAAQKGHTEICRHLINSGAFLFKFAVLIEVRGRARVQNGQDTRGRGYHFGMSNVKGRVVPPPGFGFAAAECNMYSIGNMYHQRG